MGRFPKWISSSGNESVLQRCLQIVKHSDGQSALGHIARRHAADRHPKPQPDPLQSGLNHTAPSHPAHGRSAFNPPNRPHLPTNQAPEAPAETRVILLSGDAGCGMSAITHQLSRRLCRQGVNVLELPESLAQPNPTFIDGIVEALALPPQMMSGKKPQIELVYSATFKLRQIQVTIVKDVQLYMRRRANNASSPVTRIAGFIRSGISKYIFLCGIPKFCDALAEGLQEQKIAYSKIEVQRMPFGAPYIRFVTDTINHLTGSPEIPKSLALELHQLSDGLTGTTMKHIRCLVGPSAKPPRSCPNPNQSWFCGYCRPVDDETYSSWLMRNAFTRQVWSVTGAEMDGCRRAARSIGGMDVDRVPTLIAAGKVFLEAFQIPTLAKTFHLKDARVFPSHYLLAYCPQCLADDVAAGRLPSWRKVWRQYGLCVCDKHEMPVILSVLQHPNPDPFFKGWEAFCEYVQSPLFKLKRRLVSGTLSDKKLLVRERRVGRLIVRVQRWMIDEVLNGRCQTLSPAGARFLLNVLLHEPIHKRSMGGFARVYFDSRDLSHVFYTSARNPGDFHGHYLTASPRQTATAYLLIGIAFGVIKPWEAAFLQNVFGAARDPFPTSRSEIAFAATRVFLPEHWAEIMSAGQVGLRYDHLLQIRWVFEHKPATK